jgi:DNA-binding CsgD family transcriptional regulator/tetratricopeptide (TPR) repeat protein
MLGRAYVYSMWPIDRPPQWVGRSQELATLREGVEALRRDEGTVVWVEGEAGIGKSSLVAEALAGASELGWGIGWGFADQLTERMPLSVMQDCLQVRPGSPDPQRAHAADLLRSSRMGLFRDGDASVNGIEVLVTLAEELCAAAPLVMVVEDLQWADNSSLIVWHQLAASIDQLRLLLIGTCRSPPRRPEVQQVRAGVVRRGGAVITLGPLPETDVAVLVTAMVGAPPGDALRRLTARAAGNPLYVRELVDALVREQALQVRPVAEVSVAQEQLPASLAAALGDRLSSVSAETAQMLRTAALLGGRFAVTDLAVVLRRPVSDLAGGLQEAVAAGIVAGSGAELAFRHPARTWLIQAAPVLTAQAPQLAADLLRRELDETPSGDEAWDGLMASLVWALLAAGSYEEAARRASRALTVMTDPVRKAETFRVLARAQVSARHNDDAITTVRRALASAEEAGDTFATAHALAALWFTHGIRRDHAGALDYIDQALRVLGDDPGYADLRSYALEVRIFTLQNLDRWPEAELALQQTREFALRSGSSDRATWATAAVLRYWLGQWDDALAELSSDEGDAPGLRYAFLREDWPALLVHGVAALIAGRRDQRTTAGQHLRQGLALPIQILTDRENRDFLLAAHALALEQSGETRQAMLRLAEILPRREGEMTLTHQWLPDLVRLAIAAGDRHAAQAAARACQAEAAAETRPARAAAASLRCDGLLRSDPGPLRDAVAHYRSAGPAVELPAALEDLAVVLAERGRNDEARVTLHEAVGRYDGLQAAWDIRRADSRLRPYGIRRGVRSRRGPRATSGWEALTPTEVKIAALVAGGAATPDIARGMFLSRRTVQTHISHILTKLGAKGRVDIVREALRQGISA